MGLFHPDALGKIELVLCTLMFEVGIENVGMVVLSDPKDCQSVDPIKFEAAYRYATNDHGEILDGNSPEQAYWRDFYRKRVIHFQKIPFSRAVEALEDRFPEREDFHCAALRFWALLRLLAHQELNRWVKTDSGYSNIVEIHPAVFSVAATIHLNENGDFSMDTFLKELERLE